MNMRVKASVVAVLLLVTATSPKTLDGTPSPPPKDDSGDNTGLLAFLGGLVASSEHQKDAHSWIGAMVLPKILQKVKESRREISEVFGVNEDFMKPLIRLIDEAEKLQGKESLKTSKSEAKGSALTNSIDTDAGKDDMTTKFLSLAKNVFLEEYGGLDTLLQESGTQDSPIIFPSLNLTSINLWEVVRSTWARVLSYVEEQNSLESFMQRTPVKIIDRVLSLGDDLNLASFLAKKLDPEFAEFLAAKAEPLLGPLRDADSLVNLTQAMGLGGALDYLTSEPVKHTLYTLAGLLSAHLENRVNSDLARQFLEFMSQDNVELTHFYWSLVSNGQHEQQEQHSDKGRARRDVLDHIVSAFEYDGELYEDSAQERSLKPEDQVAQEDNVNARFQDEKEIESRDGGYGSGYGGGGYGGYGGGGYGYGYMSTLDPYVVLGALALGTLLGFLLFRLINGTPIGRRNIGDGSFSLWQSDVPVVDNSRAMRYKRAAPAGNSEDLALPDAPLGDVWSSVPLVGNDTSTGLSLEEDDLADHLNQLWRAHSANDSTACVRNRLCRQLAEPETIHASLALLLSSTATLLGVVKSGELLDDVTGTLTQGNTYSCPSAACSFPL